MTTMPTRVDRELFDAAKSAGGVHSRSAVQQLNHWARIGREFEASAGVSQRDVERVLAGEGSYDALTERDQAIVRATWDERVSDGIAGLNFEREFESTGERWSESDDTGAVVTRGGDIANH